MRVAIGLHITDWEILMCCWKGNDVTDGIRSNVSLRVEDDAIVVCCHNDTRAKWTNLMSKLGREAGVEELLAMCVGHAIENDWGFGLDVAIDCVVAVPVWFTDVERAAMRRVIDLCPRINKLTRIIRDVTAVVLAYEQNIINPSRLDVCGLVVVQKNVGTTAKMSGIHWDEGIIEVVGLDGVPSVVAVLLQGNDAGSLNVQELKNQFNGVPAVFGYPQPGLREWNPSVHALFPHVFHVEAFQTILCLRTLRLPKDIIFCVIRALARLHPCWVAQVCMGCDPLFVCARGAAVQSAILAGGHEYASSSSTLPFLSVANLSIGVGIVGVARLPQSDEHELEDCCKCLVLIKRNTPIPCGNERTFNVTGQHVVYISIWQGERLRAYDNIRLAGCPIVYGLAPEAHFLTLKLSIDGQSKVHLILDGVTVRSWTESEYQLSKGQCEHMIIDGEHHAPHEMPERIRLMIEDNQRPHIEDVD